MATAIVRCIALCILYMVAASVGCVSGDKPLSSGKLLNAEYQLPTSPGGRVTPQDGTWHNENGRETLTVIDTNTRGDLNGDGVPDAIVLLVYEGGGSGSFNYLAVVLSEHGRPRHVASADLGDRVKLQAVVFDKGRIVATLLAHGDQDPMCCPTVSRTVVFAFVNQRLAQLDAER